MQPDQKKETNELNETNMDSLSMPAESGAPNGLSANDSAATDNRQVVGEQSVAQGSTNQTSAVQQTESQKQSKPKKSNKGLIISFSIILVLLIVGITAGVVMMSLDRQNDSSNEQSETSEEVDGDEEEEIEVGEPKVEIGQIGTAEINDGTFSLKDQSGAIIAEDNEMASATGIKACEGIEDEVQPTIRCEVTTESGKGIYVYYPNENVLKYGDI